MHLANTFLYIWILLYGIPNYVLIKNGPQFVSKVLPTLCFLLGFEKLTTTAYHQKTKGQVKRYSRTLVAVLCHYVSKHQERLDAYVQPLTYSYSMQTQRARGTSSINVVMLREPQSQPQWTNWPAMQMRCNETWQDDICHIDSYSRFDLIKYAVASRPSTTQRHYKCNFDKNEWPQPTLKLGDYVFVDHPHLASIASEDANEMANFLCNKLLHRASGPYKVFNVQLNTRIIDGYGIPITVSINRLTLSPTRD